MCRGGCLAAGEFQGSRRTQQPHVMRRADPRAAGRESAGAHAAAAGAGAGFDLREPDDTAQPVLRGQGSDLNDNKRSTRRAPRENQTSYREDTKSTKNDEEDLTTSFDFLCVTSRAWCLRAELFGVALLLCS